MDTSIEAQLAQLRQLYLKELPLRMETIKTCLGRLHLDNWNPSEAAELHRHLHSLTGTAGTFGLQEISTLAREAERLLQPAAKSGDTPAAEHLQLLQSRLEQLQSLSGGILEKS